MRFTISKLAREFGLARSTLLYYDRIGLLRSAGRTGSGYRCYGVREHACLKRICGYRKAGLSLSEIKTMLASRRQPAVPVLEARLHQIRLQIRDLHHKQQLLSGMLKQIAAGGCPATVDKAMWVEMLQAAGMNDEAMRRWHAEFEKRNPQAHHEFLISLGISEAEARQIRQWSATGLKGE